KALVFRVGAVPPIRLILPAIRGGAAESRTLRAAAVRDALDYAPTGCGNGAPRPDTQWNADGSRRDQAPDRGEPARQHGGGEHGRHGPLRGRRRQRRIRRQAQPRAPSAGLRGAGAAGRPRDPCAPAAHLYTRGVARFRGLKPRTGRETPAHARAERPAASSRVGAPVVLGNVPQLNDVTATVKLLRRRGVEVTFHEGVKIEVDPRSLSEHLAPYDLVKTMRASILVLGPLVGRYGRADVSLPGGC